MSSGVLIIGGGPAGAAAAGLLARRGVRVTVLEQKTFPREKVCGEFLATASRPILRELGVLSEYDRLAGPEVCRVRILPSRGRAVEGSLPADGEGRYPRALSRAVFDDLLLHAAVAAGATVVQPCHATGVTGDATRGFDVQTTAGMHAARAVVLAHGLARRGGMEPQTPQPPERDGFVCYKLHLRGVDLPADTIAIGGIAGLYAGVVQTHASADEIAMKSTGWIPGGGAGENLLSERSPSGSASSKWTSDQRKQEVHVRGVLKEGWGESRHRVFTRCSAEPRFVLAFVMRRERVARLGPGGEVHLADLCRHNPGFAEVLRHAQPAGPWHTSGPLVPGVRQVYRDGRFFVGNAAGEVHALVGEGMTLALRGAWHLARAAEQVDRTFTRLNDIGIAYERAWRREFAGRYRAANVFANLMMRPALADFASDILHAFPGVLRQCVAWSGKRS